MHLGEGQGVGPKKGARRGRGSVAFIAGEGSGATGEWVLELSGASQHISGDKGLFRTLEMLELGTRAIKFGNNRGGVS